MKTYFQNNYKNVLFLIVGMSLIFILNFNKHYSRLYVTAHKGFVFAYIRGQIDILRKDTNLIYVNDTTYIIKSLPWRNDLNGDTVYFNLK